LLSLLPLLLPAQNSNGVTVSGLVVNGGTVTFSVSWDKSKPNMPALWSDSVWVFVDYNDNLVMKRLPVTSATATAGTVTKVSGNDQGVWIIGNARSAGSFSATVQLLTATADLHGVCAYASNYPPVAEYADATHLTFKGAPLYKMVIAAGANTYTAYSDGSYTLSKGHILQSFIDNTGAPGTLNCVPSDIYDLNVSAATFCAGSPVTFALSNTTSGRDKSQRNGAKSFTGFGRQW
jgi:hypothetical protein